MDNLRFLEANYEKALIELFQQMGYEYEYGPEIERDYKVPLNEEKLYFRLKWLNRLTLGLLIPHEYDDVIAEAVRIITNINEGTLEQRNEQFMDYLQNGVEVSFTMSGRQTTALVKLVDFKNIEKNIFKIVNQYTVEEYGKIRCDLVVFVNELPLVVIELKSPSRKDTDEEDAFKQIKHYQQDCSSLFVYNAFSVISDMASTKAGTITSPEDRYMRWKSKNGDYETTAVADFKTFFEGIFPPERFLDILKNFICFDHKAGKSIKVMGAYHQYFAVCKAMLSFTRAYELNDSKGGVFWHTQGSGKSFSMVFLVHKLLLNFPGLTVVVVTDRNDLDQQLYEQFAGCRKFLRQEAQRVGFELNEKGKNVKAQDGGRADLKKKLKDLEKGGIIFTTIQKFEEGTGLLSDRQNIIVITDEAHRSQYGEEEWDRKALRIKKGFSVLMREALPNAVFIGFTGTPISDRDRDTREVFGEDIDVYDMTQAVADGATRPVYYESRVMALNVDEDILVKLDAAFDDLQQEGATEDQINKTRREYSHLGSILCHDNAIKSLCEDIIKHYEENRQYELTGKAMIVAYNKEAAVKIYKKILELRPSWTEKIHIVASSSNTDNPEWHTLFNKKTNEENARLFKDDNSPMKIAIVVDMWLTGFDVPSLATMYVYKPMRGHNLMQAIARVNRVFPEKEGGLIVDYIGIAQALKEAMKDYTKRDRQRFGDPDIQKTALVKFREKLEICRDLLHGFEYKGFFEGSNAEKALLISDGANFLLDPKEEYRLSDFIRESELLHNAETLCRSLLSREVKLEVAYMDAVRIMVSRFTQKGKISKKEINERIATLLEQSIQSKGVVPLVIGDDVEFSLFDEAFLQEVRRMKTKNLAVELLEKLIKEQIHRYERTNLVQSRKFSDMLSASLSNYLKGMLTNEEVIAELLKMAEEIKKAEKEGRELGLNAEEKAFYDALSTPAGVRKAYSDEEFVAMTKELTEELRKNRTIDWNKKETSRAKMRVMIKRLLKKYKYPPEGQEQALETVMAQCNKWADDDGNLM